ncbi:MAG TPA: glutamate racemase [Candidatus Moranbacteria bacterium]|nr:glutamate racemase [Candidatus Moranbacteria bacterium]
MNIGIFDSGLGGLIITRSLIRQLPKYNYFYLGDTARLPYGNRSQEAIYQFTKEAMDYFFQNNCGLVIIACNTASAEALPKIQQEYLPKNHPDKKVLGVIIPSAEEVAQYTKNQKIGILATQSTVHSKAFKREIKKLLPNAQVFQQAAPLLVPLIENQGIKWINPILDEYLKSLLSQKIDTLILGCTHYAYLKSIIRKRVGSKIKIISQDEFVPDKLEQYLINHSEIESLLNKNTNRTFCVTDLTANFQDLANKLFGEEIKLKKVNLKMT